MSVAIHDARVEHPHLVIVVCPNHGKKGCECPAEGPSQHRELRYAAEAPEGTAPGAHDAACAAAALGAVERELAVAAGAPNRLSALIGKSATDLRRGGEK